jgi:hypothetical protein
MAFDIYLNLLPCPGSSYETKMPLPRSFICIFHAAKDFDLNLNYPDKDCLHGEFMDQPFTASLFEKWNSTCDDDDYDPFGYKLDG